MRSNAVSSENMFRLYNSFVVSILTHCCETWTLLVNSNKRIRVPKETSPHLRLGAQDQKVGVGENQLHRWPTRKLLATVKRRKLLWLMHITDHDSLSKTLLQGNLGKRAMLRSAEQTLDGQRQTVDTPAHAGTVDNSRPQKRPEEGLC